MTAYTSTQTVRDQAAGTAPTPMPNPTLTRIGQAGKRRKGRVMHAVMAADAPYHPGKTLCNRTATTTYNEVPTRLNVGCARCAGFLPMVRDDDEETAPHVTTDACRSNGCRLCD